MSKINWKKIALLFALVLAMALYVSSVGAAGMDKSKSSSSSADQSYSDKSSQMGAQSGAQYGTSAPQHGMKYQTPIKEQDAKAILQNYVNALNNPNLKLGSVKEKDNAFTADIQDQNNKTVEKVMVDKNTGAVSAAR